MENFIFLAVWIGGATVHTLVELYLRGELPLVERRKTSWGTDRTR